MTEQSGIERAIEVLGSEIKKHEAALRHVMNQRDDLKREACELSAQNKELRAQNKELTAQLKRAEEDRDAACSYALQLEQLLEECKKVYRELKEGGAENCKKSQ